MHLWLLLNYAMEVCKILLIKISAQRFQKKISSKYLFRFAELSNTFMRRVSFIEISNLVISFSKKMAKQQFGKYLTLGPLLKMI